MQKIYLLILVSAGLFLLSQSALLAQEQEPAPFAPAFHDIRLPIPASKTDSSQYFSLADEVARILVRAIRELRLYSVIVGIQLDSTLHRKEDEDGIPALNLNDLHGYSDAVIIVAAEIFQQGVPPESDANYFSLNDRIADRSQGEQRKTYSNNIQTRLYLLAKVLDLESREMYHSLDLNIFHTGGSAQKSKQKAMKKLEQRIKVELKGAYWFSADIFESSGRKLGIPWGTRHQINKGMVFDIVEPDQIWTGEHEDYLVPGGIVGVAMVVDTSADSSGLKILRQWREHYPGAWVVERPEPLFGLGMQYFLPTMDSYTSLGFSFCLRPIYAFDYGFGLQFIRVTDSFGKDDYGFGFGGFGIWRFLNTQKIDLGGKLGVDLEIPFRRDDSGETVSTALFSAQVGIVAELLFARKFDFVIHAGYRFATKSDDWVYSEEDQTTPAYWENGAPKVDISGFAFSIGLKYLLF